MPVFRFYYRGVVDDGAGNVARFGKNDAVKEVTVGGPADPAEAVVTIEPNGTAVLWVYRDQDVSFDFFHIRLASGTFAIVSWLVAKDAGSGSNNRPVAPATHPWKWYHAALADHGMVCLPSAYAPVQDSVSGSGADDDTENAIVSGYDSGSTSVQSALDGSYPKIWGVTNSIDSPTTLTGKIYKVVVHNPSSSEESITVAFGKVRTT